MAEPTITWTELPPDPFIMGGEQQPSYRLECSNGGSAVMRRRQVRPARYRAEVQDRDENLLEVMELDLNLRAAKRAVQERVAQLAPPPPDGPGRWRDWGDLT